MNLRKCSFCDAELPEDATVCPKCGKIVTLISVEERDKKLKELAELLEIEEQSKEMPDVEHKVTEGPSISKENGKIGLTNGKVNGLSARTGFTNGKGRGVASREYREKKRAVIVFGIILLVIASCIIAYLLIPKEMGKIHIDGNFGDWNDVSKTHVSSEASSENIAPIDLASYEEQKALSFYVKVKGTIFAGAPASMNERIMDGAYILIDADANPNTGYQALGYGFDYRIGVFGEGGSVRSSNLYEFSTTEENKLNWSAWKVVSPVKAANGNSELEISVEKRHLHLENNYVAILVMKSWNNCSSEPFAFSQDGRYAEAKVIPKSTLILQDNAEIMDIEFVAKGGDVHIQNITFGVLGNARDYKISLTDGHNVLGEAQVGSTMVTVNTGNYMVHNSEIVTLSLIANLTGAVPGSTVGFKLRSPADISADACVLLRYTNMPERNFIGYYMEVPKDALIDGAFGDWKEKTPNPVRTANPNTDICEYGMQVSNHLRIYVGVSGRIFNGEVIPEATPVFGAGGQPQPPPQNFSSGEDVLKVYFYTTLSYTNPDYLVEISGMDNEIRNAVFYVYSNGTWNRLRSMSVEAAISYWQLEFEVPNMVKNTFFYVEIEFQNWNHTGISRVVLTPGVSENSSIMLWLPLMLAIAFVAVKELKRRRYD
ncbi:MAG: zinc ribbon domain-containing protein [Thermoplasmata archaeon]